MSDAIFRYEIIYQDILKRIKDGSYPVGYRLPTEKELSKEYQVSRITSKRALDMLAEQGKISRIPGKGSYVLEDMEKTEDTGRKTTDYGKTARLIGVILDNFSIGFGELLLKSIERECKKLGFGMILKCTYGSNEEEEAAINTLLQMGVEGIIVMCVQNETYNTTLLKLALDRYPVLLVDRKMKGISIPCVTTDNFTGAKELTEILIRRGHRKLCFLTHTSIGTSTINERYEGFVQCIMEYPEAAGRVAKITNYQPTMQKTIAEIGYESEEFVNIVKNNEDCTGYLVLESKLAEKLNQALEQLREQKEIVCFDPMISGKNRVAYLKQDEENMGGIAVQTLEKMIQGEHFEGNLYVPYQIINVI